MKEQLDKIITSSENRFDICTQLIKENNLQCIAEIGVYRGEFAENILKKCAGISKYIMLDPWRNLDAWNKPANTDNNTFEVFYQESMDRTEFAKDKRQVLRGKTTEVGDQIPELSCDFVYIDGDHTLKGITIDLINIWGKVNDKGIIVGDDFTASIWQHNQDFEPTMIFPFAVYFAEAMNVKIYGLPYNQFLINKAEKGFEFVDLTEGNYSNLELRSQFSSSVEHDEPAKKGIIANLISRINKKED